MLNCELVKDSSGKLYKKYNGTCYSAKTPDSLILVLKELEHSWQRIHVFYGEQETGKLWLEEFETFGYIGRSTGIYKIPLLVFNSRSDGGGALMTDRILRIETSDGKRLLWQNPQMIIPSYTIQPSDMPGYSENLFVNGEIYSRHRKPGQAERLAKKLGLHLISRVNGILRKDAKLLAEVTA